MSDTNNPKMEQKKNDRRPAVKDRSNLVVDRISDGLRQL